MSGILIFCSNTDWKPRRYDFQSDKSAERIYDYSFDERQQELREFC